MEINDKIKYMLVALNEAKTSYIKKEVPVGAVIVKDSKIVAKAYNKRNQTKNALHHAEIIAIDKACKKLGDWRLNDCEIYVTLEPCTMCLGAIQNARIKKLYFGAKDKTSTNPDFLNTILQDERLNHKVEVEGGILEEECSMLLTSFFKSTRSRHK